MPAKIKKESKGRNKSQETTEDIIAKNNRNIKRRSRNGGSGEGSATSGSRGGGGHGTGSGGNRGSNGGR